MKLHPFSKKSLIFHLIFVLLLGSKYGNLRDRGGRRAGSATALPLFCWDLFSRPLDGAQMQDKRQNIDLNVCLYWPDF